ncbi:hypothetical protein GGTG_08027 [Gaeumannomyces tritici R3-111a-1]|uniref:Bacteriophage T5 Orf172 DNA-binding domain-containing protein n=1 Tax=Gaeumannomyces tritici (strain R3-111a-1) TaxID=644352 RepID=J3P3E0_GAET3|nr:hypothetical protein GGTG_08027 [Gaeumannomyces tritici R3-111a-1]EJT74182.1 hypothetical protein GGTG_08027 [Gaeumannomyces tritici R3-111a-1]
MAARVARPAISGPLVRGHIDRASRSCLEIEESLAQWLSGLTVRDRPADPSDVDVAAATGNAAGDGDGAGSSQEDSKSGPSDRKLLRKVPPVVDTLRDSGAPNGQSSSGSDSVGSNGSGEDPREPTSSDGAILATVFRPLPQVHQFSPFHTTPRTGGHTNREVTRRLRRPLTATDLVRKKGKAAAAGGGEQGNNNNNSDSDSDFRGGFVYVFTLPDSVAVCPPTRHVKVGMTTQRAVASRLAQVRARCGYAPVLVAAARTRHPLRVEELVHAQLGERRRLQRSGCPGCGCRHREWFEAGAAEAAEAVRVWAAWVERRAPYDGETGELREEWRRRLPETPPEDPAFWKPFTGVDVPGAAAWQGGDVLMSG